MSLISKTARNTFIFGMLLLPAVVHAFQGPEAPMVEGDPIFRVLPKDAIPAIDNPVFVSADDAEDFMRDDEYVIGIATASLAKAYPAQLLDTHEIVNDTIEGVPIAVTWCPLCFTGIVYRRDSFDTELTFGVSGRLWRENLVMYDRQTDSWWSQGYGKAIRGTFDGAELETYRSTMVTWSEWRTLYPDTEVLSKRTRYGLEGTRDAYADYHRSERMGVTGSIRFGPSKIDRKAKVVGFLNGGEPYAVPVDTLMSSPVLQVEVGNSTALVVGTPDGSTAKVFAVDSGEWSYARTERGRVIITDDDTGLEWDGFTGDSLDGSPFEDLQEIPATLVYWFAWRAFYPDSQISD